MKLKPGYLLVKMPSDTEKDISELKSGLLLRKLGQQQYNNTHGTVVQTSELEHQSQIGDTVFFGNHIWDAAKNTAFGDSERKFPIPSKYFAINNYELLGTSEWHLLIPEESLYFLQRGDSIVTLNNHVIAEPIKKEKISSVIILVDFSEEYYESRYRIFASPVGSKVERGDVVLTLKHCDIEVENPINNPILPKKFFFIELENIIAKLVNGQITPLA